MQNQDDDNRNPFLDTGLLISISVFIVMVIRCAMFGFSWVSIIWLLLVLIYWCAIYVFTKKQPDEKKVKVGTTSFLVASCILLVSLALIDKNARPKMHAFAGASTDTIAAEDEFVPGETPTIDTVKIDTTRRDTTLTDSTKSVAPAAESEPESEGESAETGIAEEFK